MFRWLRKWRTLRAHRTQLPRALVRRYGRRPHYEPEHVVTLLRERKLSSPWDSHAMALFCTGAAYTAFHAGAVDAMDYGDLRDELGAAPDLTVAEMFVRDFSAHSSSTTTDHSGGDFSVDHDVSDFAAGYDGGSDHNGGDY